MKKYLGFLFVAVMVMSCQQEHVEFNKEQSPPVLNQNTDQHQTSLDEPVQGENAIVYSATTDWSGLVTTQIWSYDYYTPSSSPFGYAEVPSDFVLIGGGAWPMQVSNSAGAFLTESRPDFNNNRWWARSKDHIHADPHSLRVYAIGLKIQGVSAATLRSKMVVRYNINSIPNGHPNVMVFMESEYKLIGGGARINWSGAGNLLVENLPAIPVQNGQYWIASGKDHISASAATIEVWAIGIDADGIPGFNHVLQTSEEGLTSSTLSSASGSIGTIIAYDGFLGPNTGSPGHPHYFTRGCPFGRAYYPDPNKGRMLTSLVPSLTDMGWWPSYASSKDISIATPGNTYAGQFALRASP